MLDREERADQIDAQHGVPQFDRLGFERNLLTENPGIREHYVEAAEGGGSLGGSTAHVSVGAGVEHSCGGLPACIPDRPDGFGNRLPAPIDGEQAGSVLREEKRALPADAASGPGNQRNLARKTRHPVPRSFSSQPCLRPAPRVPGRVLMPDGLRRCLTAPGDTRTGRISARLTSPQLLLVKMNDYSIICNRQGAAARETALARRPTPSVRQCYGRGAAAPSGGTAKARQ